MLDVVRGDDELVGNANDRFGHLGEVFGCIQSSNARDFIDACLGIAYAAVFDHPVHHLGDFVVIVFDRA